MNIINNSMNKIKSILEQMKIKLAECLKESKVMVVVSIIVSIFAYNQYIITGYTLPDGLCEGYTFYHNGDWHLACGRWFVRYFNIILGGNIIMPFFIVVGYALLISIALLIMSKKFEITGKLEQGILAAAMIVTPAVISQITYPHVFLTFAGAFLFAVIAACMAWENEVWKCVVGLVCFILMMGLYQSYIGAYVALIVMLVIYDLLNGKKIINVLLNAVKCLVIGALGCGIDTYIYNKEIEIRGTMASDRVNKFSMSDVLTELPKTLRRTYDFYFRYAVNDAHYKSDALMKLIIVGVILGFVCCAYKIIKEQKVKGIGVVLIIGVLIAILPIALNCIYIIIPYNKIYVLMTYHYVLVYILFLILVKNWEKVYPVFKVIFVIVGALLVYINVLVSNATQIAIKESYRAIETQTRMIIDDVFDLDDYTPNETKIVFVGYPNEDVVHNSLEVYQYASNLSNNQVFWETIDGITNCREQYLLNYFGINAGKLDSDEYYDVIETAEFASMPVWPKKGSVKMINGMAVVRLSEDKFPIRDN